MTSTDGIQVCFVFDVTRKC